MSVEASHCFNVRSDDCALFHVVKADWLIGRYNHLYTRQYILRPQIHAYIAEWKLALWTNMCYVSRGILKGLYRFEKYLKIIAVRLQSLVYLRVCKNIRISAVSYWYQRKLTRYVNFNRYLKQIFYILGWHIPNSLIFPINHWGDIFAVPLPDL